MFRIGSAKWILRRSTLIPRASRIASAMSCGVTEPNRRPSSPACCGIVSTVRPSRLALSCARSSASRLALSAASRRLAAAWIEAVVAGYETATAIARACHPDLRQRGFHPTGAVGVFGAAMAAGKLRALSSGQLRDALGIAASSAGGLFAFVNGGADIKRLHAGHASREGLEAALLAEQGVDRKRPSG